MAASEAEEILHVAAVATAAAVCLCAGTATAQKQAALDVIDVALTRDLREAVQCSSEDGRLQAFFGAHNALVALMRNDPSDEHPSPVHIVTDAGYAPAPACVEQKPCVCADRFADRAAGGWWRRGTGRRRRRGWRAARRGTRWCR